MFEIADESPLVVAGYKRPDQILATVLGCHKAATERILQEVASKVLHTTP